LDADGFESSSASISTMSRCPVSFKRFRIRVTLAYSDKLKYTIALIAWPASLAFWYSSA
jgi:hypothetical protein